jgi:DNA polymerase III delta subunit
LHQAEKLFKGGFEPIILIRFLSNYLQKLYHCRVQTELEKANFEEVVKSQRLFFKTEIEFRKHLMTLTLQFLTKNLQKLAELEINIKKGIMPGRLVFTAFVQNCLRKNKNI